MAAGPEWPPPRQGPQGALRTPLLRTLLITRLGPSRPERVGSAVAALQKGCMAFPGIWRTRVHPGGGMPNPLEQGPAGESGLQVQLEG